MKKLTALLLLCAASAWADLDPCPLPPSGYEAGVSVTIPAAQYSAILSNYQAVLSTADADADMQDLVAALAGAQEPDVTPERRVLVTATNGSPISFAQVSVGVGSAAHWIGGFEVPGNPTDGGRRCIYVDQNQSEPSDASDCSSATGGFRSWALVYFGGSDVNWANCGANALTAALPITWSQIANPGGRVGVNPVTGQLAYDRIVGSFFEVHTANADGSGEVCLSCDRGDLPARHIGNPVWSPDGNWIVMQAQAVGEAWDDSATPGIGVYNYLYAYDVAGDTAYLIHTVPLTLPAKGLLHPQFNHAGTQLMWAEMTDGSGGFNGIWKIVIADWDAATHTLSNLTDYTPSSKTFYETHGWSPDDARIIYSAAAGAFTDLDIWTWDLSGSAVNLTNDVASAWDEHAHFSPDGSEIVWTSSREQSLSPLQTDWWIMAADGANKRRLTRFSETGAGEYQGYNAIAADVDWETDGAAVVGYVQQSGTTPDSGKLISVDVALPAGPTAGTNGPLGKSWTYVSANYNAHVAVATGAGGESASADYTFIVAGRGVYATDNKVTGNIPSEMLSRGPNSAAGGPDFRWQSFATATEGEVQPPGGASGVPYRHVAADTDFALGFTHDQSTVQRAWRDGNGSAVGTFGFGGSSPAPTTNLNLGRDALSGSAYWDGDIYFVARRGDVIYDDAAVGGSGLMAATLTMLTDQGSFWQVQAINEWLPPPISLVWVAAANQAAQPEWSAAPASSADACDQVWAALGYDAGSSTPTGNQFIMCSPEGVRLQTGFAAQ